MAQVCPWWHAYTFDNVLRRLVHDPAKLFGPYVKPGMTVIDVGCGMGINAIGLARIVGDEGRVIALDLQQEMLDVLQRRAERAGVVHRIESHRCGPDSLNVEAAVAFANAFWMVHEVPDVRSFMREVHSCLCGGGRLFVAEPAFHVSSGDFEETVAAAKEAGFELESRPRVLLSRAAVFVRD